MESSKGPPLSPRSQQNLLVLPLPVLDLNKTNSSNESDNKENEITANIQVIKITYLSLIAA